MTGFLACARRVVAPRSGRRKRRSAAASSSCSAAAAARRTPLLGRRPCARRVCSSRWESARAWMVSIKVWVGEEGARGGAPELGMLDGV
jgi:hypothetical protein